MKSGDKDDIFITRMLEETYRFMPERESGKLSTDLLAYYIKQDGLNMIETKFDAGQTFENMGLDYLNWEFCEKNSCFRFKYNETLIDIPANWSFFNKLFVAWQTGREEFFMLSSKGEYAHFWEVFNLLTPYNSDLIFWVSDQKIFLVLMPDEKKALLPELQKKLGLTNEGPIKQAA